MIKVAFLDRDGVINIDHGFVHTPEKFEFLPSTVEALRLLNFHGFTIIIITNQSGIGRGYYSELDYQWLTQWYVNVLADQGVVIRDVFHCPHAPADNCDCRKPKSGLFLQALDKYSVDLNHSFMVGDKVSDITAAKSIGVGHQYRISICEPAGISNSNSMGSKENWEPVYSGLLLCVQAHLRQASVC
jgi:D-glycero-D-manno-heptose 1,7-bisphosphate phosphatase